MNPNTIPNNLFSELEKLKIFLTKLNLAKSLQALIFLENILEYELNQSIQSNKHKKESK
jgi:hypothetical protein